MLVAADQFTGDTIDTVNLVDSATHELSVNRRCRHAKLSGDLGWP